ncbi:MAG: hypothetical protein M3011_02000 [Actinomycetota bacterium]|nr:hypothetical protein [Actinomycetota bacterium]
MNPDHPPFEDLSAHYDGEAPEWAEHVAGCASCTSRLAELAALADTIAQAPPGRIRDDQDDPVAHAIESVDQVGGAGSGGPVETRERHRRWVPAASAAAVVVISIAIGAVVASKGPHRQMTRDALTAGGAASTPDRSDRAADAVVVGGDLGVIPDRAALVTRVAADLRAGNQRRPAATPDAPTPTPSAAGSLGPSGPSSGVPGPSGPSSGVPAPAQGDIGTRPCEVEARGDPGDRGEVVYQATAEEAGEAAVVLAFRSVQSASITVELRARSDCRLLVQGSIL